MSNHAWTVWVGRIAVLRKLDLEQRVGVAELGRLVIGQTGNRLGIVAGPRRRIRPWHRADHFALSGGMMLGNSSRGPDLPFRSWCLAWVVWPRPWILMKPSAADASYWSPSS